MFAARGGGQALSPLARQEELLQLGEDEAKNESWTTQCRANFTFFFISDHPCELSEHCLRWRRGRQGGLEVCGILGSGDKCLEAAFMSSIRREVSLPGPHSFGVLKLAKDIH